MANKALKSIKFPGLNDTYTIPQVDNTLAVSGAAADAKKTGDELGNLKSAVNVIDKVNYVLPSSDIIQGSYSNNSTAPGKWVDNSKRIRNEGFISVIPGYSFHFVPGTNAAELLWGRFANGSLIADSSWITTETTVVIPAGVDSIILVFAKSGRNTDISPSDYDATVTIYSKIATETLGTKSAVNAIEDVVFAQAEGITKTNGKYMSYSGVQGTTTWCNLYEYTPKNGEAVLIDTYAPLNAVPGFYYNGVAYPDSSQSAGEYSGSIVGDGTSILYVNSAVNDGAEVQVPKILIDAHATKEELSTLEATAEITNKEHGTTVTTSDTANRYITAQGVQGDLNGYTLKSFTTEIDAVYLIYSEIASNVAYGGMPIVLHNNISYTNNSGKGYYIIVGNGQKCYVNSLTSATTIVEKYLFNAFKDRVPDVFLMFNNIVCCGDSLTYSQVFTSSTTSRKAFVTYPEAVQKITGTETATLATPGYTCADWWNEYNDDITGANKLYLIYLGTNESDESLTDTADTDCAGDDYTQYAENGTGYYGRIIRKILDTQSRCILIKIGLGTTGNNRNTAIAGLGERFSVPVIENPQYLLGDLYYHYGDSTDYSNTVHRNDMGYTAFAEYIVKTINDLPLSVKYALMPKTVIDNP